MSKTCVFTGRAVSFGNQKTYRGKAKYLGGVGKKITGTSRRKFKPNLQKVKCVIDGKVQRAFAIGDEGVILTVGKTTKDERTLGLKLFELRGVKGRKGDAGGALLLHPTEEHVMRLAGRWSIDPIKIEKAPKGEPALGIVGLAPAGWRQERMRKAA